MPDGVSISLDDMYRLLVSVDSKVTTLTNTVQNATATVTDHEQRLRDLEAARASDARIAAMEDDVKAIRAEQEAMKRRLYAVPSASVLIAAAALVFTLVRTF